MGTVGRRVGQPANGECRPTMKLGLHLRYPATWPPGAFASGAPPFGGASFGIAASSSSRYPLPPWPCDRLSRPRTTTAAPPRPGPVDGRCTQPNPPHWTHGGGRDPGRFPCSRRFARPRRSPTVSQRHRHEYAADLPRGLPSSFRIPLKEFPNPYDGSGAHRVRPRSARVEPVSL